MAIALVWSIPETIMMVADISTMIEKMAKNASRVESLCCDMVSPFILTGNTALGCKIFRNSLRSTLKIITPRIHLKPPVVEPEQAPINIRQPRMTHVMCGQRDTSSLKSPVVVINDTTWNSAERKACSIP